MPAEILNDALFDSLETSLGGLDVAETLPPACYTDESFYEFETEALFNHEWLCVGRVDWVKEPGDYFTTRIVGEPIVVSRARDGVIRAMSAVCQHRAMLVAEGKGNTRGFVCPYHHWVFGLDGHLVNAPAMERTCGFDKKAVRLPQFKVEIWLGFIFINFDAEAAPLAPRLARVAEAVAGYDLANAEPAKLMTGQFAWNWKVMFENNNDGYHASKLHGGPLHDFIPSELASFPDADPRDAGFLRFNGTLHPDVSFNPTQRAILPVFPGLSEAGRNRVTFANVPPTLSLVLEQRHGDLPDPARHRGRRPWSRTPACWWRPAREGGSGLRASAGDDHDQRRQDHRPGHARRLPGPGRTALALRASRGRYSWQEGAQGQFNHWLVRATGRPGRR